MIPWPRRSARLLTYVWLAVAWVALPAPASAQSLNGVSEWTVAGGSSTSDSQTSASRSFWQNYTVNFGSFVLDPRFLRYNTTVTFGTARNRFRSDQNDRRGGQHGLGYRLSAALFPARPFPLTVQLVRNNISQSGELQSASLIRGGIALPAGQAQPDFETRSNSLSVNWQLRLLGLPSVDVGYRKADTETAGGGYAAEQRDGDLHVNIAHDTERTRQALRFQKNSSDHHFTEALNQRFSELAYDFSLQFARRSRLTTRAGRRSAFSLFETPVQLVDAGTGLAQPVVQGQSNSKYASSSVSFEPSARVSLGLTGSLDEQRASAVTTTSRLVTTTARFEPLTGLSLDAGGTYGSRGQVVNGVSLDVLTRAIQFGANYRARVRWLDGSIAASRQVGENSAPDGRTGRVRSWSGAATLSASLGGIDLSTGYDRRNGSDAILDLGNFDLRRRRASAQWQGRQVVATAQWDRTLIDRGRGLTLAHGTQHSYSTSLSFRWRAIVMSANVGGFDNRTTYGHDRTFFAGVTGQRRVGKVQLSASLRDEKTSASANQLDQNSLVWFAKAEYTRRLFGFVLEYRRNAQHLQFLQAPQPTAFRGRQFNVRILRKFGMRL